MPRLDAPSITAGRGPSIWLHRRDLRLNKSRRSDPVLCLKRPGGLLPAPDASRRIYAVRCISDLSPEIAACAAARRAIGTRYGEHDT